MSSVHCLQQSICLSTTYLLNNGCPHKQDYKLRKYNVQRYHGSDYAYDVEGGNILVAEEQFQWFAVRTQRRMDLVFNIDSSEVLEDVTTIDANNPSNGFLSDSGLSPSYFPGAATVIAAKKKWDEYGFLRRSPNWHIVPFVIEVQVRWEYCARHLFKHLSSKTPIACNRVSRNFWSHKISLANAKCTAANTVHIFFCIK